jgi:hypothetical protein
MATDAGRRAAEKATRESEAISKRVSRENKWGLPPLLNAARLEHGIMDEAFGCQAMYDRIYVFQISEHKETFGDTRILMPETSKDRELETCPMGVIVSAGLTALDNLRSHGCDLGHTVTFLRLSPYRHRFAFVNGVGQYLVDLHAGDVTGSVTLAQAIQKRVARYATKENDRGYTEHYYIDENGKNWKPQIPWQAPEY